MESTVPVFFTKEANKQHWPEVQQTIRPLRSTCDRCGSSYYQVTRPLIFILRLFGGFPYTVHKDVVQVKICSWWTFYSLVVMASQDVLLLLTTHQIYLKKDNPFDAKLFDVINITVLIYQAFGPFVFWFELPAIVRYYAKWHRYENDLRLCNITLDERLRKWLMFLMLPSIPYVLMASYYQAVIHGSYIHIPSLMFLHIHSIINVIFWFISGLFLHSTANKIMRRIKKVADDKDAVEMAACRRIWLSLSELTADLGNAVGPTLMVTLLFTSTVLIADCYFLMFFFRSINLSGTDRQRAELTARIFYIVLTLLSITILCEYGQRCTNAVGSNLLQELLRLNASPQEKRLHREVNMFIQAVWLRYPDMVLCGFLTLNRRLLVSLFSGGVTYLIVLVQFRSSSESH